MAPSMLLQVVRSISLKVFVRRLALSLSPLRIEFFSFVYFSKHSVDSRPSFGGFTMSDTANYPTVFAHNSILFNL